MRPTARRRPQSVTTPSGSVTYEYDAADRLTGVQYRNLST